jgi:feruloyl esterase
VTSKLGDVSGNYRFFLVPGMNHCSGGPGPWVFNNNASGVGLDTTADLVTQLMRWVEIGTAPEILLGTKYVNDTGLEGVVFQRPVCAYPREAVWNGNGKWQEAKNWECKLLT